MFRDVKVTFLGNFLEISYLNDYHNELLQNTFDSLVIILEDVCFHGFQVKVVHVTFP